MAALPLARTGMVGSRSHSPRGCRRNVWSRINKPQSSLRSRDIVDAFRPTVDQAFLLVAAANVLLFVPLGAVPALRGLPLGRTVLAGLALSGTVEAAQLLVVPGRTTSVDDLLLNTLGAVAGHLALSRWTPPRPTTGETLVERV